MKRHRITAVILAAAFVLAFSGCGSSERPADNENPVTQTPVPEPAAETTPELAMEPATESETEAENGTASEPVEYSEKEFVFGDIVLKLDEGFKNVGKVSFTAVNQKKDEDTKTLGKKDFGTLSLQYKSREEFDTKKEMASGEVFWNVIENPAVGTILWQDTSEKEEDVSYNAHFMVGEDHYQADFENDKQMQNKNKELKSWFIEVLHSMDLTEKAKEAAAKAEEEEAARELAERTRIKSVYVPGEEFPEEAALWMGRDLEAYGYPGTAPERQPEDPVRVLAADYSETVIISGMGAKDITEDPASYASFILSRFNDLLKNCISGEEQVSRIAFTSDPAEADVILSIKVTYPFAGIYTGGVRVYDCHAEVQIRQTGTEQTETFTYDREAPEQITAAAGSDEVWMNEPEGFENEVGQKILEWFPEAGGAE